MSDVRSPLVVYFSVGVTTGWDVAIDFIETAQAVDEPGATLSCDGYGEGSSGMTAGATFGCCRPGTGSLMRYGVKVLSFFLKEDGISVTV